MSQSLSELLINELPENASERKIESTAQMLEDMHYEPMLLHKAEGFFRMRKEDLGAEVDRAIALPPSELKEELKQQHIQLLIYYYELLCRLRNDESSAWDTIYELYEDD